MQKGQAIHSSVAFTKADYVPKAIPPSGLSWKSLPGRACESQSGDWGIEYDNLDKTTAGPPEYYVIIEDNSEDVLQDLKDLWHAFRQAEPGAVGDLKEHGKA